MPSKIDSNLKTVIDQFTPEILGMFWITNEDLSRDLLGFDEFNYLFDGLISQYLYGQTERPTNPQMDRSNIFFTKNYNQFLFLSHLKVHDEIAGVLDEHIALIHESKNGERNKILVFNQTKKNWILDLKKRYPKYQFISLELSH